MKGLFFTILGALSLKQRKQRKTTHDIFTSSGITFQANYESGIIISTTHFLKCVEQRQCNNALKKQVYNHFNKKYLFDK